MGITQRIMFLATAAVAIAIGMPARPGAQTPAPAGFAYADACKTCHTAIYDAWAKTKHARTINRLSAADQQKECIGCHTTGPGGRVEANGKFVNASVQCESCHGAASAHVAAMPGHMPNCAAGLLQIAVTHGNCRSTVWFHHDAK